MDNKIYLIAFMLLIAFSMVLIEFTTIAQEERTHVYYGYVPPSTDLGNIDELINGEVRNYTPPPGTALLDIIGIEDRTKAEIWDLVTKTKIASIMVNRLEKKTIFIPYGTYFKVISNKRVMIMLSGGNWYIGGGMSLIYPSVEGGFRGKEFIFIPATVYDSYVTGVSNGYNMLIISLTKGRFKVIDSSGEWSLASDLNQHEVERYLLWCRIAHGSAIRGAGNSMIFRLKSQAEVMLFAVTSESLIAIPALTGGYIGRLFVVPTCYSYELTSGVAVIMIIPQEPGKVEIYDLKTMRKVAEKSFSESDVAKDAYWFYKIGKLREKEFLIKSTGDILVYAGGTGDTVDPYNIGPDVTFIGIRPNQRVKFFVPSLAVIFAPEHVKLTVDGVLQKLSKDEFLLLDPGMHTVKADKVVIIEILCTRGTPWKWGVYLIEPFDVIKSFEVPRGFGERGEGFFSTMLVAGIIVIALIIIVVFLWRRKRIT